MSTKTVSNQIFSNNEDIINTINNEGRNIVFVSCTFMNISEIDQSGIMWFLHCKFFWCTITQTSSFFVDCEFRFSEFRQIQLIASFCRFVSSTIKCKNQCLNNCTFQDTEGQKMPLFCPSDGSFVAWKKALQNIDENDARTVTELIPGITFKEVLVKLFVPANAARSSGADNKCRVSKAKVLGIYELDGKTLTKQQSAFSWCNWNFWYATGKIVEPDVFNDDRWKTCGNGIHCFVDIESAKEYKF